MPDDANGAPTPQPAVQPGETLQAVASKHFNLIFISLLAVSLIALGAEIWLSVGTERDVSKVIDTCDWVVKFGFGAVGGMITGKATK